MTETPIQQRLAAVHERIRRACDRYGRDPTDINLLAVSKTKPPALIQAAHAAGQRDFGENYLQDALAKIESLPLPDITWHFIGAIQSNKTRSIAEHFSFVHTLASEKIASRLNDQRPDNLAPLKVMVQVNVGGEASKSGIEAPAAVDLIGAILHHPRLEIRGLMAIPEPFAELSEQRREFAKLRRLMEDVTGQLGQQLPHFVDLSMGMTGDLEAAVAEGTTWLRIGTAIFGERDS